MAKGYFLMLCNKQTNKQTIIDIIFVFITIELRSEKAVGSFMKFTLVGLGRVMVMVIVVVAGEKWFFYHTDSKAIS